MKRFHLLTRLFIYLTNVQGAPITRHGPSSGETAGNKSGDVSAQRSSTPSTAGTWISKMRMRLRVKSVTNETGIREQLGGEPLR